MSGSFALLFYFRKIFLFASSFVFLQLQDLFVFHDCWAYFAFNYSFFILKERCHFLGSCVAGISYWGCGLFSSFVAACVSRLNCADRGLSFVCEHLLYFFVDALEFFDSVHDVRRGIFLRF